MSNDEMDHDDDADDDLSMRSMRSVWLQMRDEEPPASGMAALMAAARAHAPPPPEPAWRRALAAVAAAFRRPPVLALATITLLVSGGLIVTRHHDEAPASAVVAQGSGRADTQDRSVVTKELPSAADPTVRYKLGEGGEGRVAPTVAHDVVQQERGPVPAHAALSGQGGAAAPEHEVVAPKAPVVTVTPDVTIDHTKNEIAVGPADDEAFGKSVQSTPSTPTLTEAPVSPKPTAPPPPPPPSQPPVETAVSGRKDSGATSPASLVAQCHTAAARGDCANAKALAAQIAKQDATLYRTKVAPDEAIAKCLAQ